MSNISTREAQARVEAATPSKLMVPTIYLTHHEQQEYIAHMQKGVEQFLRVLHKTRDVFSVFRADVKEKTSRAGEERQQLQEWRIRCVSPTDLLAQSRSHLGLGVDLAIGHNPLKENEGWAAGKDEQEVIVHVQYQDQESFFTEKGPHGGDEDGG